MLFVRMGLGPSADGHAVVLNPRPAGGCSFAAGDARTWADLGQVMDGVCRVAARFKLFTVDGDDAELCAEHAAHTLTCAHCSTGVGRIERAVMAGEAAG